MASCLYLAFTHGCFSFSFFPFFFGDHFHLILLKFLCVYILYAGMCMHVCGHAHADLGGASVKGIVSKWQRGTRENDSYVCGLITINSPFDYN